MIRRNISLLLSAISCCIHSTIASESTSGSLYSFSQFNNKSIDKTSDDEFISALEILEQPVQAPAHQNEGGGSVPEDTEEDIKHNVKKPVEHPLQDESTQKEPVQQTTPEPNQGTSPKLHQEAPTPKRAPELAPELAPQPSPHPAPLPGRRHSTSPSTASVVEAETGPIINFNNVNIIEFLRFASRLSGKNFIFDPNELQFSVTIISESPATIDEVMTALLQNLQIHGFELVEQGSSLLIHRNPGVKSPAGILKGQEGGILEPQIATQVFLIQYVDPARVAVIVKNMLSKDAMCELIEESKRLVVTDVAQNIVTVSQLLTSLDSPHSGLEIGQYVGQNGSPTVLATLATELMGPITTGQTFVLVPHAPSNSVFVVSSPFLVDKALSIMQKIDLGENASGIFSFDKLKFDPTLAKKMQEENEKEAKLRAGNMLSEQDIEDLSDSDTHAILKEKGYSDAEIAKMSKEQIRTILSKIHLGPLGLKIRDNLRKKRGFEAALPLGHLESTTFFIHKLQYRRSEDVVRALHAIATSLSSSHETTTAQSDLVVTLNTIQPLEESNSIVLTGTQATLQKAKELIQKIDVPVRQVFIEVLVLNTTITNSLNFGVEWGAKFQRRNFALEGGLFESPTNNVPNALAGVTQVPPRPFTRPPAHGSFPAPVFDLTPNTIIGTPGQGLTVGTVGREVLFNGQGFLAFAGLIHALRSDEDTNIIMNPKITTEHNVPAEVYVGAQIAIRGQSVSNNNGNILTTNYQTVNTGVLFKVTPLISSGDMVTLIIEQRISSANQAQVAAQGNLNAPPATINETRALTRVHLPSDYFLIMSGMIQEERDVTKDQIPCLGGLPLVGSLFSTNSNANNKQNLMMFIRPHIIENEIDIEDITKKQQDIFKDKSSLIKNQRTIADDLKDMLNL